MAASRDGSEETDVPFFDEGCYEPKIKKKKVIHRGKLSNQERITQSKELPDPSRFLIPKVCLLHP